MICLIFQSTLPRRERPQARADREQLSDISIHAPAKGATAKAEYLTRTFDISIHAPAKGATISRLPASFFLIHFNPRSREGSDRDLPKDMRLLSHISIHAPAKGATLAELEILPIAEEFQSTLPRRERLQLPQSYLSASEFQSTLPRRERRLSSFGQKDHWTHFNPRSREGSDICCAVILNCSINFNPRSREGSDTIIQIFSSNINTFQSTLPRRERLYNFCFYISNIIFQSTLPRRERRCPAPRAIESCIISIHAPAKGATLHESVSQ